MRSPGLGGPYQLGTHLHGGHVPLAANVERPRLLVELWQRVRVRRLYWMLPTLLTLLLVGVLIVAAQASPLAPFIYPLF